MALHFYINGTEGGQDGEELSNGDFTKPLLFDGFYPGTGVTLYKALPIYIRADAGETYYLVQVEIRGNSALKFRFDNTVGHNGGYYGNSTNDYVFYNNTYYYKGGKILGKVGDTNKKIMVLAAASGDETNSPDLTTKIYARSCYNGAS